MVRAEGGSLRFWGPGLLSTSPAFSMSSASHSAVPVAGWPKKREPGPLSSGQGKSMQFVDPDRIEQSNHVQAASFAPSPSIIFIISGEIMPMLSLANITIILYDNIVCMH